MEKVFKKNYFFSIYKGKKNIKVIKSLKYIYIYIYITLII